MVRRLLVAMGSATAVATVATVTWFDLTHLSMSECLEQEAKEYPYLEQVAQQVMGPVGDRVRKGGLCEDALEPGAYVHVSVYDWSTRKQARTYLREAGSTVPDGDSTSRGVRINYATTTDHLENSGQRFVTVSFSLPR